MIRKVRYKYTPVCDGCGFELPHLNDYLDAVADMKNRGWSFDRPSGAGAEWFNFGPICADKRNNKNAQSLTKE